MWYRVLQLSLALLTAGVIVQTSAELPSAEPNVANLVTHFYAQDIFITPGRGFRAVQLGAPFQAAVQAWGPPQQVEEHPLFGLSRRATWAAGPDGKVVLSGANRIREMEISGGPMTTLQTVEGVRFGMPGYQVTTIYGPAGVNKANELAYPARGISFGLSNGLVASVKVFPPGQK
jgi:hypothetical protein